MKKFISILMCLALLFGMLTVSVISVNAETLTSGDYEYSVLDDGTVEITKYIGSETEIEIPNEIDGKIVTRIGNYLFYYEYDGDCGYFSKGAFENNRSLESIVIPNGVTSIDDRAFNLCTSLTSIAIPKSVTIIGDEAFRFCTSLSSITIPDSVTSIGNSAFYGCSSLKSITIPNIVTSIDEYSFCFCSSLTGIIISNSVTSIGDGAFRGCTSLKSITIPNNVTSIGEYAFWDCSSLTSIVIPDSVTSIGEYAFSSCTSLTSITIGNSITEISDNIFNNCNIRELILAEGTKSIALNFATKLNCKSTLEKVTIPDTVTVIGDNAFSDCSKLTSITLPNNLQIIGSNAFYNCLFTEITIPKSVKLIGSYAIGYYNYQSMVDNVLIDGFVINGYSNTIAETYAKNNGIKFNAIKDRIPTVTQPTQSNNTTKPIQTTMSNTTVSTIANLSVKAPKLTSGKKLFKVKYTKVKNAVGFQLKYKTGKGKWVTKTFSTKKSATKTIKGLKKGKYKVQIRTFTKGKKAFSKWSATKTVKVK